MHEVVRQIHRTLPLEWFAIERWSTHGALGKGRSDGLILFPRRGLSASEWPQFLKRLEEKLSVRGFHIKDAAGPALPHTRIITDYRQKGLFALDYVPENSGRLRLSVKSKKGFKKIGLIKERLLARKLRPIILGKR